MHNKAVVIDQTLLTLPVWSLSPARVSSRLCDRSGGQGSSRSLAVGETYPWLCHRSEFTIHDWY